MKEKTKMITLKDALELVIQKTKPIAETEKISLMDAYKRVLAEDVHSDIDQPPFNKSTTNGYACRQVDLPGPLKLVDTLEAGTIMTENLQPGTCVKIAIGARVPIGADFIIQNEASALSSGNEVTLTKAQTQPNICNQGDDIKEGQCIAWQGKRLAAPDLAILASAGHISPRVFKQPTIGILCTGNELIEAHHHPEGAKIRNSNIYQLWAQVNALNCKPRYYGIVADDKDQLVFYAKKALSECDMLITTGGATFGLHDLIFNLIMQLKGEIHFSNVAIHPGKPVIFATCNNKPVWGLSGFPVSSFLQFHLLTKACLNIISGTNHIPNKPLHKLSADLVDEIKDRDQFIPVKQTAQGSVYPISFNDASHIAALHDIYGFVCLPAHAAHINNGELVECIPIT
jgi:molybdopterin molybdotransferase